MLNLLVANLNPNNYRYCEKQIELNLKAQIENSYDLGWNKHDLIILSNFDFKYMGVKTVNIKLNDFCLTGSKMFGIKWLFDNYKTKEIVWAHDLDVWQNNFFSQDDLKYGENFYSEKNPNIINFDEYDVGASFYSRPKYNGGSIYWKISALDIIEKIIKRILDKKEKHEEPTINKIFKSEEYKNRVATLSYSMNLGCSGFVPRFQRAEKPIKVVHMNVLNRLAWETHTMDRNNLGEENIPVTRRLERLIRKYFINLPIKIKEQKYGKRREKNK